MFFDRFKFLCTVRGVSRCTACELAGLSRTTWVYWSRGKLPTNNTAKALAEYFDVSVEYLLYGVNETDALEGVNEKTALLLNGIASMSPVQIDAMLEAMQDILKGAPCKFDPEECLAKQKVKRSKQEEPKKQAKVPEEVVYLPEDSVVRGLPLSSFVTMPTTSDKDYP